MSIAPDMIELLKKFSKYMVFYPDEDESGFDGIHYGGFKCLSEDAPESAIKAYEEYEKIIESAKEAGYKI